jgi:ubiquitin thioesterase protein OTUB1
VHLHSGINILISLCELAREHKNTPWGNHILNKTIESKNLLTKMNYDMSILEDFYEPFYEALTNPETNVLEMFTTDYTSDTIVCFLRILTAAFLKSERENYEGFVIDSYPSLEMFLAAQVEPSILD